MGQSQSTKLPLRSAFGVRRILDFPLVHTSVCLFSYFFLVFYIPGP